MKRYLVVCPIALVLWTGSALADTTQSFTASGNFVEYTNACPNGCVNGSISGTELIDTTLGTIVGSNLAATLDGSTYSFTGAPVSQGAQADSAAPDDPTQSPNAYQAIFADGGGQLDLNLSIYGTLAGYTGGAVCSFAETGCGGGNDQYFSFLNEGGSTTYANDGALTAGAIVTTPEPSSLALLGTGALGLAGAVRRRVRTSWRRRA